MTNTVYYTCSSILPFPIIHIFNYFSQWFSGLYCFSLPLLFLFHKSVVQSKKKSKHIHSTSIVFFNGMSTTIVVLKSPIVPWTVEANSGF